MAAGGKRRSFYADLDHMRSLFDSVDASKTGLIGFKELCVLVQNIPGIEEATVPELMDRLDRDKDGKVRACYCVCKDPDRLVNAPTTPRLFTCMLFQIPTVVRTEK